MLHEAFKVQEWNFEVIADVRDLYSMWLKSFHRHDCASDCVGARDNERISIAAASDQLLLLYIGLEVRHRVNLSNQRSFLRIGGGEELGVCHGPFRISTR